MSIIPSPNKLLEIHFKTTENNLFLDSSVAKNRQNECVVLFWWQPHWWIGTMKQHLSWRRCVRAKLSPLSADFKVGQMFESSSVVLAQRGQHLSNWQGLFLSGAALMGLSKNHANKCPSLQLSITTKVTKCLVLRCWLEINKLIRLGDAYNVIFI